MQHDFLRRWQYAGVLLLLSRLAASGIPKGPVRRLSSQVEARPRRLMNSRWQAGYPAGVNSFRVSVNGVPRRFLLFVPTAYDASQSIPLWILAHGTADKPETFLTMTSMAATGEKHSFAFVALEAIDGAFNVEVDAQANPSRSDDVVYTMAVLREVTGKIHVDLDQIPCVGFSRGARFCSRLASELSGFISGIAVVAGVRYPMPNNASRALPVIAIHGTDDPVNPYHGKGQVYWGSSVDDAVKRWAAFNDCTQHTWEKLTKHVLVSKHTGCTDGSDVTFLQVQGGGHTWPGSSHDFGDLGAVNQEVSAQEMIADFLKVHAAKSKCHTATLGEACYGAVQWAMDTGILNNPGWYVGLTTKSSFEDFQDSVRAAFTADCPRPCPPTTTLTSTTRSTTSTTITLTVSSTTTTSATTTSSITTSSTTSSLTSTSTTTTTLFILIRFLEDAETGSRTVMTVENITPVALTGFGFVATIVAAAIVMFKAFPPTGLASPCDVSDKGVRKLAASKSASDVQPLQEIGARDSSLRRPPSPPASHPLRQPFTPAHGNRIGLDRFRAAE